jgi:hypothetical protein
VDIFKQVQDELLTEALNSPHMLADLAGLERYIAESYSSRAFIELLQNSDDAGADRVKFVRGDGWVICANSGREFNLSDFRSLCRSASSNKERGRGIGYRGIGFKSVVGIANEVHLISESLRVTFSRHLTDQLVGGVNTAVPLIRIPHLLNLEEVSGPMVEANLLLSQGYTTLFILEGINQTQIDNEFDRFNSDHLIFLNNVRIVVSNNRKEKVFTCDRSHLSSHASIVSTSSPTGDEKWKIESRDGVSIAFSMEGDNLIPLTPTGSIVHAFLPTLEQAGIGVRINGDFSTDPSRTRVVLDDQTEAKLNAVSSLVCDKIIESSRLETTGAASIIACLKPNVDEVSLRFQNKSFRSELISKISDGLQHLRDTLAFAPTWLNAQDARALSGLAKRVVIPSLHVEDSPVSDIARFAGVKSVSAQSVLKAAESGAVNAKGCAELIAFITKTPIPVDVTFADFITSPVWEVDGVLSSLESAVRDNREVSPEFVKKILDSGVDAIQLKGKIKKHLPDGLKVVKLDESQESEEFDITSDLSAVFGFEETDPFLPSVGSPSNVIERSINPILTNTSFWRSAELSVLNLLNDLGFEAEDHSRQNVGYDLLAVRGSVRYFVEVKSISHAGQAFSLTPNEDSYARDSGDKYILALVLRAKSVTHIQFISNPRDKLQFVKQCRQWAWECVEYRFDAQYRISEN